MTPATAKEAAWQLHLENAELRKQRDALQSQLAKQSHRLEAAYKARDKARADLYRLKIQVRWLQAKPRQRRKVSA